MPSLLHILTRREHELADRIIEGQRQLAGTEIAVVDLTAGDPDYDKLLESIFAADSVAVW